MTSRKGSGRVNAKGRNTNYASFVWFDRSILRSEAYHHLSGNAVKVLLVLMAIYKGMNNGDLWLSARDAAEHCNVAPNTANRALRELEEKGFIVAVKRGAFSVKNRQATVWRLTMFDCGDDLATKEFMRWRAPSKTKHGRNN